MKQMIALLGILIVFLTFNSCIISSTGTNTVSTGDVSGTLLDLQGNPVADALVRISSDTTDSTLAKAAASSGHFKDSTRTDGVGHFRFHAVKKGHYNLECSFKKDGDTQTVFIPKIKLDSNCDVGHVAPIPLKTLYATQDADMDHEGWNVGLGSDLRLIYSDARVYVGFTGLKTALAGKKLQKAELILHGTTASDSGLHYHMYFNSCPGNWIEGTGNWYYFDGAKHNSYDVAYKSFPDYVPPAGSENPATASGIRWGNLPASRPGVCDMDSADGYIPAGADHYLPLDSLGRMVFDVTKVLPDPSVFGDTLFSFQLYTLSSQKIWMYSKDFVSPQQYGPQLVLHMK